MIDELILLSKIEAIKREFCWKDKYITTSNMKYFLDKFKEYIESNAIIEEYDEMDQKSFLDIIGIEE